MTTNVEEKKVAHAGKDGAVNPVRNNDFFKIYHEL